ncbi:hypothetical protein EUGRSUZ_K02097 [Eucalyptus grandis]|uniref:Uncharacterized protein n=2 Tax=Eucalyptus grandis TaxID=71139 RepID=A0ACC3IY87_EUCGR|nr:hypothetical protein EUGRSUZ_K02097 [Eucalyptus grandis]
MHKNDGIFLFTYFSLSGTLNERTLHALIDGSFLASLNPSLPFSANENKTQPKRRRSPHQTQPNMGFPPKHYYVFFLGTTFHVTKTRED